MADRDGLGPAVPLTLAVAQVELALADIAGNLRRCLEAIDEAAGRGARLVVLPECALTGYAFDDEPAARRAALALTATAVHTVQRHCARAGIFCVVGLLERRGGELHNTAALIAEDGTLAGVYRKAHLPLLGVDRFVTPGAVPAPVLRTKIGRIAINICYDIRFPEAARLAALAGADVIAHPASWPVQASALGEHFAIVRAAENRVVVAAANRGDCENGVSFLGMSQIVAPDGRRLASAAREPAVLVAEVDLAQARAKRTVRVPGAYETDVVADRRVDLYGALSDPISVSSTIEGDARDHVRR